MKKILLALGLISAVLVAGCIPGAESDRPLEITFEGSVESVNQDFFVTGQVTTGGFDTPEDSFSDVVVCLSTKDGRVLNQSSPEELGPDFDPVNITLTTETTPELLVINSSTFWENPDVDVGYYAIETDEEPSITWSGWAENADELPVQGCSS